MVLTFLSEAIRTIIIMTLSGGLLTLLLLFIKPMVRHRLPKSAQYYFWLVVLATFLIPASRIVALPVAIADIAPIYNAVERNIISATEVRNRHTATERPILTNTSIVADSPNLSAPTTALEETLPLTESELVAQAITIFMVAYPFILVLVLLYNLIAYARFVRKIRSNYINPHSFELDILRELTCGKCSPMLIVSSYVSTPMLIGFFRPAIVLPNYEFTEEQMRNILHHELTHMRRLDIAIKWLSLLACTMHWFNPFVWIAKRELDRVCELSCDEIVIRNMDTYGKQHYGETLISVAFTKKIPLPVLSTTMCEEKRALKERLTAIMKSKKHTKLAVLVSAIILLAVIMAACATGAGRINQSPGEDATSLETIEPDAQQGMGNSITEPAISDSETHEPGSSQQTPASNRPDYITILGEQFNTNLTELSLNGALTNEDIVPLRYMTELTALWFGIIDPFNQITDLSPLAGLTNLRDLYLIGDYISDITPLAGLENLTHLSFIRNQVVDISPLAGLTNLEMLQFGASQVSDITPLAGLTNLTSLDLSWNQITDITPLAGLTNLHSLFLRDNQITDITPLAGLADLMPSNLAHLHLSNNQISDLTPLAGFYNLESLWVNGNPITDFSAVAHVDNVIFEMQ